MHVNVMQIKDCTIWLLFVGSEYAVGSDHGIIIGDGKEAKVVESAIDSMK